MRLLHVDSSILGAHSVSRTLSADIVEAERRRTPGLVVIYRDLAAEPLQHISGEHLAARPGATAELQLDVERGEGVDRPDLGQREDVCLLGAGASGTGRGQAGHRRLVAGRPLRGRDGEGGVRPSGDIFADDI